ncbi:MAG TPA: sulfatase-like hydrolase/transferase [Anaerolineaceae bacterium]
MTQPPNILLVICDQLRAFEIGCYGNPVIHTPGMDRLAAEGVRFETAISNYPVCMPARSVLLSGQYNRTCTGGVSNVAYPGRPGDFNMPEYPEFGRPHLPDPTLPELLQAAGYHTAVIGKWHVHSWPHQVGFDRYLIPRVHHCHSGQLFTENGGMEFSPPGYSVDYEADRVEAFLRQPHDQPFFLYYSISPPHNPLRDAPEKYLEMYDPAAIPLRPNVDLSQRLKDQDYWFKVYRWDFRYYNLHLPFAEELPADYNLRQLIAEYYGLTTWVDDCLGRVLRTLDETGLAENTVVVFTSDHGDNLGSNGLVQKGGPNEEAVRIPLLLRGPGLPSGGQVVSQQVASLVDLAPTLLSLAGVACPAHFHGSDLLTSPQETGFIETGSGVGVRTCSHLYFLPFSNKPRLADSPQFFYDLQADPYQQHNLAGSGVQVETARALDALLRQWHAGIPWMTQAAGAPQPTAN